MKKIYLIALVIFSCSETTSTYEGSQIPPSAIVQDYDAIPGLQRAILKAGPITIGEGDFLNGLHHGTWTIYDNKGKISRVTSYLNGKKQGPEIFFETTGSMKSKSYYHNDVLDGEFLEYKRNAIVSRIHYSNGKMNGLVEKFYVDGTPMEASYYKMGVIDGSAKWFNQKGELMIEYTYDMGERETE